MSQASTEALESLVAPSPRRLCRKWMGATVERRTEEVLGGSGKGRFRSRVVYTVIYRSASPLYGFLLSDLMQVGISVTHSFQSSSV